MIHTGDCVAVMRTMPPDSVDAIVTDPPYGLEFTRKEWYAHREHCHKCGTCGHSVVMRVVGCHCCETAP